MIVNKFNGIFYGDDMPACMLITVSDHCSLGCCLAGTGASHKQNQTNLGHSDLLECRHGQSKRFKAGNLTADPTCNQTDMVTLSKNIDSEPAYVCGCHRKVEFVV